MQWSLGVAGVAGVAPYNSALNVSDSVPNLAFLFPSPRLWPVTKASRALVRGEQQEIRCGPTLENALGGVPTNGIDVVQENSVQTNFVVSGTK